MAKTRKITKRAEGLVGVFSAYDGNEYTCVVEKVNAGVAKVLYQPKLPNGQRVWAYAYIEDAARIKGV